MIGDVDEVVGYHSEENYPDLSPPSAGMRLSRDLIYVSEAQLRGLQSSDYYKQGRDQGVFFTAVGPDGVETGDIERKVLEPKQYCCRNGADRRWWRLHMLRMHRPAVTKAKKRRKMRRPR
jgi:hypothetical protein